MYLFYNILNNLITSIEAKMVQQVDALLLVSKRQDEFRGELEDIKKIISKMG